MMLRADSITLQCTVKDSGLADKRPWREPRPSIEASYTVLQQQHSCANGCDVSSNSHLESDFATMRDSMIVSQLRPSGVSDPRLLSALRSTARESFVPAERRAAAYIDRAVPITRDRSINPPLTTALLLNAAAIGPSDCILIVGSATGYAAAVAAAMSNSVFAIDADAEFVEAARIIVPGVTFAAGPLSEGFAAHAPYDAIVVDGAIESVPDALIAQLAPEGRLCCAILVRGLARLAVGRRGGTGFALAEFADSEAVALPGFALAKEFIF